jgi:hypothetical protein
MLALLRYTTSVTLRSHRIVAPATLFFALVLIINTDPGPAIETYGSTLALLAPTTIWIALAALNSEDAPLAATTSVLAGGPTRLRLAKVMVGVLAGLCLGVFALVVPLVLRNYPGQMTGDVLLSGLIGHVLAVLFGAGVAPTLMSPTIERSGIAFLVASMIVLVELIVPGCPPVRDLLQLFYDGQATHLGAHLAISAIVTIALSAAIAAGGLVAAQRRS